MKQSVLANAGACVPKRRRPRRSQQEVQKLLIDAAIQEFTALGFAQARTADIAKRAGVVEPLLFKYFTSKAHLFQIAIFETLDRHYKDFVAEHPQQPANAENWEEQAKEFIGHQQDFLRAHSRMFMSLVIQESFESGEIQTPDRLSGLQSFLDGLSDLIDDRVVDHSVTEAKLVARISFASILASVLFSDWLFPQDMPAERIKSAVVNFITKGADMVPKDSEASL